MDFTWTGNDKKRKTMAVRVNCRPGSIQKQQKLERSPWSDLPDDLLITIFSKICLLDQIRCAPLCKTWKQLIKGIRPADKLPWQILYDWRLSDKGCNKSVCKLFVPSHLETYTVKVMDGFNGEEWRNFTGAEALYSRYGYLNWILVVSNSQLKKNTNTLVSVSEKQLFPGIQVVQADAIYFDGILYCLLGWGTLGAFKVANQQWSCLHKTCVRPSNGATDLDGNYLIMVLLLRLVMNAENGVFLIWRFDFSEKKWVNQASLGDYAAFVGWTSFLIPAAGEISEFAGNQNNNRNPTCCVRYLTVEN
ncbi:unnamed protein product [Dovyalis caffra]|uniref:F-box domain-containing protein n=1 Tax=Dovyalis caffra TaxID=77055 RepID=A0AAV1RY44_9ROSI|nr:unnamed protein product [Dovyalis caffra]